jgi:hypothetical protein
MSLTDQIQKLINLAQVTNVPVHTKLLNGLHLWLVFNGTNKFKFIIGRQKVTPSFREWNTCLDYWPYPVPISTPRRSQDEHGRNFYLTGFVPFLPTLNDADGQTPPHIS